MSVKLIKAKQVYDAAGVFIQYNVGEGRLELESSEGAIRILSGDGETLIVSDVLSTSTGGMTFNDAVANTGALAITALTAPRTWTLPDATGNVALETGVNFGPAAPASITVVNGIITAIA